MRSYVDCQPIGGSIVGFDEDGARGLSAVFFLRFAGVTALSAAELRFAAVAALPVAEPRTPRLAAERTTCVTAGAVLRVARTIGSE